MLTGTVKEFSLRWKVEYVIANALMNFLVLKGFAKAVGSQPNSGGRGKPSVIYSVPEEVTLNLK